MQPASRRDGISVEFPPRKYYRLSAKFWRNKDCQVFYIFSANYRTALSFTIVYVD